MANQSQNVAHHEAFKEENIIELLERIAGGLEGCCLTIDESGHKTKNEMFEFPGVIDHTDDVKDVKLYDIDTEKLLFILDVELKDVLTGLLHYSPGNGQKLEKEFKPIKKWAISLDLSTPRPSKTRFPRMADYPSLVIGNIGYLTFHLPERAEELRRVAELLRGEQKAEQQEQDGLGKTGTPSYEVQKVFKVPVSKLVKRGEDHTIEFKETLEYDVKQNKHNKDLNKECLKTIAAFLNTDGGTLLIGVRDDGEVKGIDRDLQYVQRKNRDGFELKLRNLLRNRFAPPPFRKVKITFKKPAKEVVCRIDVNPVSLNRIIHLDDEVYIREGNTTIKLAGRALADWIQQRSRE